MISLVWLLMQAASAGAAPPFVPAVAPWTVVDRTNPATGARSVSAAAVAPGGTGRLVVRCDHAPIAVVSVQFIPRDAYRGFGVQPVSLQFDGGTALIDNWELLGAGAIEREEHAIATLTMGIAHARRIHLHTVDRAGVPLDLTLDGPTDDLPIRRVVEACGQVLGQVPAPPGAAPTPPAGPAK
ncbi:hypothetical protein [uncultured Sphingomonas sp.]|uniref:hypothetical protein n=1 Tax=uncultured Sphingomonas sp. TaxID=158754 RepID=UPI0035CCA9CD